MVAQFGYITKSLKETLVPTCMWWVHPREEVEHIIVIHKLTKPGTCLKALIMTS
jgi:hypothetical protein